MSENDTELEDPIELGPFTEFDLKSIVEILESKNVTFEIVQDELMYEEQQEEYNKLVESQGKAAKFAPAFLFVEVNAADETKVRNYIAKFLGVV